MDENKIQLTKIEANGKIMEAFVKYATSIDLILKELEFAGLSYKDAIEFVNEREANAKQFWYNCNIT